ncbi:alpha-acetolactate decarboxylase [Podospora appendiculata]|uniref:Alpha-acetolactate decarboxylase n=1 Tax=Podospora appendiculata TaxID=314037 RepID=A0AAE0XCX3_9PEZI|nr:alpha-acetolactate decarboxylase [Podospora appendiculata]
MAKNELFQYSIMSALMDGVASHGIPIASMLAHGDHGLGTFKHMVGEMIVLDGVVYQMKSDGRVVHLDSTALASTITPFASVTRFQPTCTARATITGKEGLSNLLSRLMPTAKNHFLAIRIDGVFSTIYVRTAGGQLEPREKLPAVGNRQTVHTFDKARGTIIGFRTPQYMMGINVAGDHLHFISDDRERGGHILAFESEGDVDVGVSLMSNFHLELPTEDEEFNEAALVLDAKGIHAIEG